MMRPNDLVTDDDLRAYEASILTSFGRATWADKRQKALTDWLWPLLVAEGFPAERFRTRYHPDRVVPFTGAAYGDELADARDQEADDINLATVFATPGSDALFIGSTRQFRGLSIRMSDSVSAVTSTMTVSLWTDAWEAVPIEDGTARTAGQTFSGGGAVTWRIPEGWVVRSIDGSDPLYWAKVMVSATPTSAKAGQIGVIRDSLLTGPLTLRTLALIMREAPTKQDGPWREKADWYEHEAERAWQRVRTALGGEFDTQKEDDQVSEAETGQTVDDVTGGGWTLERG